jgi:Tol biopolymer transport system component
MTGSSKPVPFLSTPFHEAQGQFSPDGKWVIFTSAAGSQPQIFKVPIEGGTAQLITDKRAAGGRVSPDGKLIMFTYADSPDPYAPPNRIGVIPFEGNGEEKDFEIPSNGTVPTLAEWSLDGKSVIYTVNANNVSNLWSQSLSGGPAKQITDFKDGLITGFAYSNDGKILACSRGTLLRDAVLITDVKTDMK